MNEIFEKTKELCNFVHTLCKTGKKRVQNMKHTSGLMAVLAAVFCIVCLSACEKEIVSDNTAEQVKGNSQLVLTTRTGDPSPVTVAQSRVYIFSSTGSCVRMLSTTESSVTAEDMAAGTYTLYAVGGDDLSKFMLPDQADATAESVIQVAEGKTMGDLLMTTATVTLQEGEERNQNLAMIRKVFCLENITIRQVPADVTAVEVALEPIYTKVKLDGTMVDETAQQRFALTSGNDGTWSNTTEHMLFPSKGNPSIVVYFTRGNSTKSYAYTASAAIEANHHFTIEGTYTETQGVSLMGVITGAEWGEDRTITFDFNETNVVSEDNHGGGNNNPSGDAPTVGGTYLGCYVAAVNGTTVTLVSPTEEHGFNTSESKQEAASSLMNTIVSEWTVDGVTGTWRLPTPEEASVFLADPNYIELESGLQYVYYVNASGTIQSVQVDTSRNVIGPSNFLGQTVRLRPVIDITY